MQRFKIAVLFVRDDSEYKNIPTCDCYDADRNALTFSGNLPVIAHPPCRARGVLSHMAKPRPGERELAVWAVGQVRKNGGCLEHPAGSRLWKEMNLPLPGAPPDEYGGHTVKIDQYDFDHVANKPTHIYICGCPPDRLPPLPMKKIGRAPKSITGQVPGTARCTQYEREYTPTMLINWLCQTTQMSDVFDPHGLLGGACATV